MQTIVSADGFRDPDTNAARHALLEALLESGRRAKASALFLPGGFVTAPGESAVDAHVAEVGRRAGARGMAVFGGVDLPHNRSAKRKGGKGSGGLPYFGFATASDGRTLGVWRQVSADGAGAAALADDAIPGPERVVRANGRAVGVLICGELFNSRLRASMAAEEPDLILDLGHVSMTRVVRTVRNFAAEAGCAVGHSHHLAGWYGRRLHWAAPGGQAESEYADEGRVVERDGLWAAWTIRRIGEG
jgi:hypothetical protein